MANPQDFEADSADEYQQEMLDQDRNPMASQQDDFIESDWQFRREVMKRNEPNKLKHYFSQKTVLMANLQPQDIKVILVAQQQINFLENLAAYSKEPEWRELAEDYGQELTTYLNATGGYGGMYFKGLLTKAKEITRRMGDAFKPNQ